MAEKVRFQDAGEQLYDFCREDIWLTCPQCQGLAIARPWLPSPPPVPLPHIPERRLVCASCGYFRTPFTMDTATLSYRLETPCCGHTLWALNPRHLRLIENYVRAELREHAPAARTGGYHNQALVNRLPEWMIVAKHRDEVLRAIARIRRERLGARVSA